LDEDNQKLTKKEKIYRNKYKPFCKLCGKMIMTAKQPHRKYCNECKKIRNKEYAIAYQERRKERRRERNANKSD
jgi:hypothetical protein